MESKSNWPFFAPVKWLVLLAGFVYVACGYLYMMHLFPPGAWDY